ncbi:CDP-alcohol phosphatidyltransferase family protein [Nonlabens sp.]|uniref:CDP-alcohol phosphatidyltransferase family protein n=1 Tax=Nonlabens sp. TaxID=1888209 RepID=UPI001BCE6E69|nr:CDP-alcohol phosphatidyltransferase family protein [Nonlabens sp.]
MKNWVPNIITLLNLLCGCIAALYAFNDQLVLAGIFVAAGIFFDFFDGLAARLLKVSSDLGAQLDSLADMVTSGLVPGIVMYQLLSDAIGFNLIDQEQSFTSGPPDYWISHSHLPILGFLITLGSCYRLAKFNVDTRQTDSFIGVPTPANAILIISLGIIAQDTYWGWLYYALTNPYILIAVTLCSVYILNAEMPLFALKFKSFGWKGNEIRWIFIGICIALILALQIYAVPCIIIIYMLMSVVNNIRKGRT